MDAIDSKRFVKSGNAIFTIEPTERFHRALEQRFPNLECQPYYTYRIKYSESEWNGKPQTTYFISLLTGPDNTSDYTYLGIFNPFNFTIKLTKKSCVSENSAPFIVLKNALKSIYKEIELPGNTFRHEGRCGACGRPLTVPESIDCGIGPICLSKM